MFYKIFNDINQDDLKKLVTTKMMEGQQLEYKESVWGRTDDEIREMLRDICSMANKGGGYFIVGIREGEDGTAQEFVNVSNAEEEQDRIWSSCLANIQPRLTGIQVRCIKISGVDVKEVILIHVPSSFNAPHLITFRGLNQFWGRHDRQKSCMAVSEIRDVFKKSFDCFTDSKLFFEKRIKEAERGSASEPLLVMLVSPLAYGQELVDVLDVALRGKLIKPAVGDRGGFRSSLNCCNVPRPSLNGIIVDKEGFVKLELYRTGNIEFILNMDKWLTEDMDARKQLSASCAIIGFGLIEVINEFIKRVRLIYEHVGYDGQVCLSVHMLNMNNIALAPGWADTQQYLRWGVSPAASFGFDAMTFDHLDVDVITKRVTDRIWQAFGYEQENYLKEGKF